MSGGLPRSAIAAALAACLAGCGGDDDKVAPPAAPPTPESTSLTPRTGGSIEVTSHDFANGASIPKRFARPPEGAGGPPEVSWGALPVATKEVVLLVEDPDAGAERPFVHWLVYGMDPKAAPLSGGKTGKNDFGDSGWGGPLPPKGSGVHRYRFRVFALDALTTTPAGATWDDLLPALRGHVLAEGRLVGTYVRR